MRITPDLGRMVSDVTKVRQILLNLLSNAAKFTEGGVINLSVDREPADDGERVVFKVDDTAKYMEQSAQSAAD